MKLLILDGNSVINRAYFGVKPLTTRDGLYTHAIYGFLNILERMEKEEQPEAVCVAFDLHGPTFRHLKYDGYKATRHAMPEELAQQMPIMKDVLRAMNIPIYECQGWEADDVIGTVGKICSRQDWECVIVTGDRDSLQLIDGNVHVKLVISKPGQTTTTLFDEEKFREEYGFEPKKLIDLKALMGDSSDNIPGVAGVGPKTAKELLAKFGSLDGVYAHLDDPSIRPKLREKLEAGKENAYLSFDLATIRPEAPIDFAPKDAIVQPYNRLELYQLFQKLEFVRLIDKYGLRGAAADAPKPEQKVQSLPRREEMPADVDTCAVYLAEDGSVRDVVKKRIGIRTLTISQEKDRWGQEFAFIVNGVKIFTKGGNYIPEDCCYTRITKERQEYLVRSCVRANFNCLRVWGGGYYPNDTFYDLCDEYGLIVWQDLMYACNVYDVTDAFAENIRQETLDNVRRLRHHACLGLWCGNNEIESAWDHWGDFQKETP